MLRIGDGQKVPIWLEAWLPNRANLYVMFQFFITNGVYYVSDLIQNST